jgi:acyl-CoA thioesterase FadM
MPDSTDGTRWGDVGRPAARPDRAALMAGALPRRTLLVTHPPPRHGPPVTSKHVPFYLALEVASQAWAATLAEYCGDLVSRMDMAVVNVTGNFFREVFVGEVDVEVALKRIGTSSVTFLLELFQAGHRAGTVDLVVAQVDAGRVHAVPLSPAQRAALQAIPASPGQEPARWT